MISIFKKNNFYYLIFFIQISIVLINHENFDYNLVNFSSNSFQINSLFDKILSSKLIYFSIVYSNIILQIYYLLIILNDQRILSNFSIFPVIFYFIISTYNPIALILNNSLIINTIILISFKKIFDSFLEYKSYKKFFEVSLLLSIGANLNNNSIIFFFLIISGLYLSNKFNLRYIIIVLIGYLTPFFFNYTICKYLKIDFFYSTGFRFYNITNFSFGEKLIILFISLLVLLNFIINFLNKKPKSQIDSKKNIQFNILLTVSLTYLLLFSYKVKYEMICLIIPLVNIFNNLFREKNYLIIRIGLILSIIITQVIEIVFN